MNARLGFSRSAGFADMEAMDSPVQITARQLVYRALLLDVPPEQVCKRLGVSDDHGRWTSSLYERLARLETALLRAERGAGSSSGGESVDAIVRDLRGALARPRLDPSRVARLLRNLARRLCAVDCMVAERLVREVDAALFLAAQRYE